MSHRQPSERTLLLSVQRFPPHTSEIDSFCEHAPEPPLFSSGSFQPHDLLEMLFYSTILYTFSAITSYQMGLDTISYTLMKKKCFCYILLSFNLKNQVQLKTFVSCSIDKPKALSLLLHTADISHPAKSWDLHHRWTTSLLEEFFRQASGKSQLDVVLRRYKKSTTVIYAEPAVLRVQSGCN